MENILYIDRRTGEIETEKVAGEKWLRWLYLRKSGRPVLEFLIKHSLPSLLYGWLADRPLSAKWVKPFVENYAIDTDSLNRAPEAYPTFNSFFYRPLKRPLPELPKDQLAFPAEGRHLAYENIADLSYVDIKGEALQVADLIGMRPLPPKLENASMLISRLCPTDYHRYHFPLGGIPSTPRRLPGYYYSVSPYALKQNARYFTLNKREVTRVHVPTYGFDYWQTEIGATFVGRIRQTYQADKAVSTLQEKGYFAFGASMVICLFESGRVAFDPDLVENTRKGYETCAPIGDKAGKVPVA